MAFLKFIINTKKLLKIEQLGHISQCWVTETRHNEHTVYLYKVWKKKLNHGVRQNMF